MKITSIFALNLRKFDIKFNRASAATDQKENYKVETEKHH